MFTRTVRRPLAALLAATALALGLAACGTSGPDGAGRTPASTTTAATVAAATAEPAGGPFGPACAALPSEGAGSLGAMAEDPVATAASNNPQLSTLTSAITKADLVDTLNSAKDVTVFAPTDDAFRKLPQKTLDALLADKGRLTALLTYHVLPTRLDATALAGTHPTLQGDTLTVSGSGDDFTVNGSAEVVCGDVPTSNATVHLVDTVLMPPA
ncbi:fasciclin domain-containing protein [Kitasatospora sp. NPDC088346]|uniref:fasciclin domain-containing protein n=1 Tax=Kitasatospora sp. NPDC088346 TaxID=3364073 RepID=UPI003806C641